VGVKEESKVYGKSDMAKVFDECLPAGHATRCPEQRCGVLKMAREGYKNWRETALISVNRCVFLIVPDVLFLVKLPDG
jgi:hypothetical protein